MLKFTREGKFIKSFGKKGSGPGEMEQPHALAMDSRGRLFVGDRCNNRIQIYDQDGKLLDSWSQFSRPSGIYIDANDMIYVADSESESVSRNHDGWKRGIRIGSAKDGKVPSFIPDPGGEDDRHECCRRRGCRSTGQCLRRRGRAARREEIREVGAAFRRPDSPSAGSRGLRRARGAQDVPDRLVALVTPVSSTAS